MEWRNSSEKCSSEQRKFKLLAKNVNQKLYVETSKSNLYSIKMIQLHSNMYAMLF